MHYLSGLDPEADCANSLNRKLYTQLARYTVDQLQYAWDNTKDIHWYWGTELYYPICHKIRRSKVNRFDMAVLSAAIPELPKTGKVRGNLEEFFKGTDFPEFTWRKK